MAQAAMTRIEVRPAGERPYTVQIGIGLLGELVETVEGSRPGWPLLHPRALRATAEPYARNSARRCRPARGAPARGS